MRISPPFSVASAALVFLLAAVPFAGGATAPARPNLTVTSSTPPAHLPLGTSTTISVVVKNTGRASAAASTLKLTLSGSAQPGTEVLGTARVGLLAAGASKTVRVSVTVPSAATAGYRKVVACADAARLVTESSEADNCRAASTHVM